MSGLGASAGNSLGGTTGEGRPPEHAHGLPARLERVSDDRQGV
jgi:hypothetical protein